MKKCTVLLAVVAAGLLASAAEKDWFDAKIDTYTAWPTNDASFGGSWSNASSAALADGKIAFRAGQPPLAFVAAQDKTVGTDAKAVRFVSKIDFKPYAVGNLPEIPAVAKAGVVVVKQDDARSYYVVLGDGGVNGWKASGIAAAESDSVVTITVATNGVGSLAVTYQFGANSVSGTVYVSDATVRFANFAGNGEVSALSATYDSYTLPLNPGTNAVEVAAATEAEALAQVEIVVPDEAKGVVTDTAAYSAMFKKTAEKVGEGTYRVTVVFDPANPTVQGIQKKVDDTTAALDLGPVTGGEPGTATVDPTVPGLFYVLEADGDLKTIGPVDEKLGDGSSVNLTMPAYPGAGFYRLKVSPVRMIPTQK